MRTASQDAAVVQRACGRKPFLKPWATLQDASEAGPHLLGRLSRLERGGWAQEPEHCDRPALTNTGTAKKGEAGE